MSDFGSLGLTGRSSLGTGSPTRTEYVQVQHPLHRILGFCRRTIDDVVNSPLVKNEVLGYYKVYRQVRRGSEVQELERQWNAIEL